MKKIIGIGFSIPSEDEEDYCQLNSYSSLSECDIAIFNPSLSNTDYSTFDRKSFSGNTEYEGKKLYNKESSVLIIEHSKHWKTELTQFVNSGKTLLVILSKIDNFFIHTGENTVSGTGRNQKVTNLVTNFSNYDFLPFKDITFKPANGKAIIASNPLVQTYLEVVKDYTLYDTYISKIDNFEKLFTTKNKDKILGGLKKIGKGNIIFIPNINLNIAEFSYYNEKKDEEYWTDEAIKFGKMFKNTLVSIDKSIKGEESKTPTPDWCEKNRFQLIEAEKTKNIIKQNTVTIEGLKKENKKLLEVLNEQESLKDLLFESGKTLERAVTKALRILGYEAEGFDDGTLELDQVIISPEGLRYIGECEGKDSKDIDVSKFRQLLDSLNEDFERDEVEEKAFGLIFGNPQRLMEPSKRHLDFTQKCKNGAKREKIGLVKTTDLFIVCQYLISNKDENIMKACRSAIGGQLGEIIKFPEIPKSTTKEKNT